MKKNKLCTYIAALICAVLLFALVGCTIGDKPVESGDEETSGVIETTGESATESPSEKNTDGDGETSAQSETEEETETKDYGMGFVPV